MIGSAEGPFPLLGAGLRAGTYAALQWNGALLHRVGAPVTDGLTLVALASAPAGATEADLVRGVTAGLTLAASTEDVEGPARPTRLVLAAAACAAVTRDAAAAELETLPDLAAALMVVTSPDAATDLERDLWGGHWLAAGWLTPLLQAAGITGATATYTDTVSALTGTVPAVVAVTVPPAAEGSVAAPAARVLAALS